MSEAITGSRRATHLRAGRTSAWLRILPLVLTLLGALLLSTPARAAEVITSFVSDITLRTDGAVEVTETISVIAEGNEIRRGIFRDIFTTLTNPDGSTLRSTLDVVSVTRNGRPEHFTRETVTTGIQRIRIGNADVFLEYGPHTYTIRYTMTRMGRFFERYDELYWNATGNYWNFPIQQAVANITLPPGAEISNLVAYTGPVGSTEQAVEASRTSSNTATFRATRVLGAGEGLTVAAAFQKGILVEPEGTAALGNWLSDQRDLVFPVIAVLIVLFYNLFAWSSVGRDPARGTIIPLFHPPRDFSPALTHYVHRMGWHNAGWTAFTATIFSLGVKGLATIDNAGKKLKFTGTDKQPEDLRPSEKVVHDYLDGRGTVTVDTKAGPSLNTTRGKLVQVIENENRAVYFKNNYGYVVLGVAISALLLIGLVALGVMDPVYLLLSVIAGIGIGVAASLFNTFWKGNIVSKLIIGVWLVIGGGNLFGGLLELFSDFRIENGLIAAISIVVINVVFAVLMRAPTVQGRKVMDQIDGLKMYLETAEKNRLNFEGAPAMTVSRFERILPYAIALGVEKPWSEHFEGELARHAVADAPSDGYHPNWYHGRSNWSSTSGGISKAVAAATTGMAASMVAAQPASSSSSGFSGGGGSSGGGGGGGGGGGW